MSAVNRERTWLEKARAAILYGDFISAQVSLQQALAECPDSVELRRAQAGVFQQTGRITEAQAILQALLAEHPGDAGAAFALARILMRQGRTASAAATMRACFTDRQNCRDPNLAIDAIELLDDCERKSDAAVIARDALVESPFEPRLHAYAGMLELQLGDFARARQHYLSALEHDAHAWEWHLPMGLSAAQRYADAMHPDFALFNSTLQRSNISDKARTELHFALGKAFDDLGEYTQAAHHFRSGNATAHRLTTWSRKAWRRGIEARLAARPITHRLATSDKFTPIFVVGMPRSGTTLLSRLLAQFTDICNRGELPWIARLAGQPVLADDPGHKDLQRAAAAYTMHARQDDAANVRWFIDKQPLNFRYVDLMLAMFPAAKIVYCTRIARDTALSLWMQCFLEDVQGYAYDFGDIALVMHDCERLMARWHDRHAGSIRTIRYEDLAAAPQTTVADLAQWIGLTPHGADEPPAEPTASIISTASLWQARQPVNTRSVERWRHYVPVLPELLRFHE